MKINAVEIKPGNILEYENGLWRVVKTAHTQPGKGGAFMQVEMKNLIDGRKTNVRFRSQDTIERVRLDTKDFQYLYAEGDDLVFMDVMMPVMSSGGVTSKPGLRAIKPRGYSRDRSCLWKTTIATIVSKAVHSIMAIAPGIAR